MKARRSSALLLTVVVAVVALVAGSGPAAAASKGGAPQASFARVALSSGAHAGTVYESGALRLAATLPTSGTYADPFGGAVPYHSGTWTSATVTSPFAFDELVASWNATTPDGTWIKIEMEATGSGRTTKRYVLGIWASGDGTIHRTSVPLQGDGDGFVAIDTFIRSKKAAPLNTYTLHLTLYRADSAPAAASPSVRFLGAMTSAASTYSIPSTFAIPGELDVPMLSQEEHVGHFPRFDNGGEAWCSPTSTAMVLDYWERGPTAAQIATWPELAGHKDSQVDYAARYVYDWNYQGAGNWPYNTAYAATFGLSAFVTRLRSLTEAELFINKGIPLVASINGKLPGFFFGKTNGHLLVIIGFTPSGDVITNDPAVPTNEQVRVEYNRADFEKVWLEGSAGIVYVIYDDDRVDLPTNVGPHPNW